MSLSEDLRQCRIVIREAAQGKTIADTTIVTYDANTSRIEIEVDDFGVGEGETISALIFSKSGLFETQGTVGASDGGKTTIVLYEGSDRDDRHAVRYQVNISGVVDYITRQEQKIPDAFEITVLNMSSIGLLVQAPEGRMKEGDTVRFSAVSKGQKIFITAQATRVEAYEAGMEKVGCTIQLVNLG